MPSFPIESSRLKKAAETAVRESLKIKKDETVLIITNPQSDVLESRKKPRWISPKNR